MKFTLKAIFLLFIVFTFQNCSQSNYIALHDAEMGMFMERAQKVSINTFFNRRMESDIQGTSAQYWQIFNEDIDYVYFGKIESRNGIPFIHPFYRVDRESLQTLFPGYTSIEGKHVKSKVFQNLVNPLIEKQLIPICPQSYGVEYSKKDYSLTENGIETAIRFTGRCYEEKIFSAEIKAILDPTNLDIISEETNIK